MDVTVEVWVQEQREACRGRLDDAADGADRPQGRGDRARALLRQPDAAEMTRVRSPWPANFESCSDNSRRRGVPGPQERALARALDLFEGHIVR